MIDNELNFLSSTIFIEDNTFRFRPYRKNGCETILTNYKKTTISKKYLVSNISTMLHNSKNSSSDEEILLKDIKTNLKPILGNNCYPLKLLDSKFKQFLEYGPKPKPPDVTFTLCISYSSKNIDFHIQKMIKQIKIKALECLIYSPLILNRQKINLIQPTVSITSNVYVLVIM